MRSSSPAGAPGLRPRRARTAALLVMVAIIALVVAVPAQAASMFDVADKIMCQCGCGAVLSECPHQDCGWGIPAKEFITQQLANGKTEQELIQYYVSQYGEKILAAPTKSGFNMAAWITPFAGLILGGVGLYYLVRLWARRREDEAAAEALSVVEVAELPDEAVRRLEDELKNFD